MGSTLQKPMDVPPARGDAGDDLVYVNARHSFPITFLEGSAEPLRSPFARLVSRLRRAAVRFLLRPYLDAERDYFAHLARALNHLAERDEISSRRQADYDEATSYAIDRRVAAAVELAVRSLAPRIDTVETRLAELSSDVRRMDSVLSGIERIIAAERRSVDRPAPESAKNGDPPSLVKSGVDYSYLLLENRYRGSEEEIARRLSIYGEVFGAARDPVLEIGAGRGELQRVFREKGVPSYGIELDEAMVLRCREQGLDVRFADAIEHLSTLADGSLGGIVAIQVIEHLDVPVLNRLFGLAASKLRPGGIIAVETIHTQSLVALCHNYFRDPTHKQPLHPDTTRFLMELAGLTVRETRLLSPFPDGGPLREAPVDDHLPLRWQRSLRTLNLNIETLNRLLYGHQDYCVVAARPERAS